jgi:hypothetical protein
MAKTSDNDDLTELLNENESGVREWFDDHSLNLVHECRCGYTTYDAERVNEEVQAVLGDARAEEIHDWSCNLSNQFGWMDETGRIPEEGIYYCQHCGPGRPD